MYHRVPGLAVVSEKVPGSAQTHRVAVLGSSGYIGSTLVRGLRHQGIETFATSRSSRNPKLRINVLDSEIASRLKGLGATAVVDCSGSVPATRRRDAHSNHVAGTRNLTAQLSESGIDLVHIATALPHGTSDPETQEYLHNKLMAESLVRDWLDVGQGVGAILRLDSIYGPQLPRGRFLSDCARAARLGYSFRLTQPKARRGFTHERDLVAALTWILNRGRATNVTSVVVQPSSVVTMAEAMELVIAWVRQSRLLGSESLPELDNFRCCREPNAAEVIYQAQTPFDSGIRDALEQGLGLVQSERRMGGLRE